MVPTMNMDAFDHAVWKLHRKLFHRYIKYAKYFARATEDLSEFQHALENEVTGRSPKAKKASSHGRKKRTGPQHVSVMDLVSSSSDEVSEDDTEDDDGEVVD